MSNEYVQQASVEADGTVQDSAAPLDRRLVWLMAVVCALSVANLYYVQPLLAMMGKAFISPYQILSGVPPTSLFDLFAA